jgi:hypothetical protein
VAELHSLRLRLDAGRLSKARRGELVHHLPTGLIREIDGSVQFHPDQSVQSRLRLVFDKFRELGSVTQVLRYLARNNLRLPRRQTSGLYAGAVLWKDPCASTLYSILKNPAYAGAFAYGRRIVDPARQVELGESDLWRRGIARSFRWLAVVTKESHDVHADRQGQQMLLEQSLEVFVAGLHALSFDLLDLADITSACKILTYSCWQHIGLMDAGNNS